MVEKNAICPMCRDEKLFLKENDVSGQDLQGLTWLFCENCVTNEIPRPTISYA